MTTFAESFDLLDSSRESVTGMLSRVPDHGPEDFELTKEMLLQCLLTLERMLDVQEDLQVQLRASFAREQRTADALRLLFGGPLDDADYAAVKAFMRERRR